MPSLRYVPLTGAALKEFYHQQAENHHGYVYPSNCHSSYQGANNNSNSTNSESEPFLGCIVSSRNEDTSSSSTYNYAADCDVRKKEDICTYTDQSNYVYNSTTKQEMDGYLSDTILDKVLNCDYSCTSETREPLKQKRSTFEKRFEELKAYKTKHGHCHVSTEKAAGDRSLGRWCSRLRQSMKKMKNNEAPIVGGFSEDNIKRLDDIGFDWIQYKRERVCALKFEKRFEELKAYKAKHGHCYVKVQKGASEYKSLGSWCGRVRKSMNEVMNNRAPVIGGFSEYNIKRLDDIGFNWKAKYTCLFDKRFNELKAYKAKHGDCDVKGQKGGECISLRQWCSRVRQSMKKVMNNEAPIVGGLSEDNIKRLRDIGFVF